MITISGTLSKGWLSRNLPVRFNRDYYFDPDTRYAVDCACNEYAARQFGGMRLFYSESNLGQIDHRDNRHVQIGGIQPNMILGLLLGADFVPNDTGDADITPGCLAGRGPADLPAPESLLDCELIRLFDEQIRRTLDDTDRGLRPIPPFFWDSSGRAAIHGVMTSAQKFMGETVFVDMMTRPQRCMEMMQWIADTYIVLCRHFSQTANLPITGIHVGECSACMVAPKLIERFVAPVTSKIGNALGPVRLHSCGPSTDHLKAFSTITNLYSLDLGGDTSLAKARQVFGKEMPISIAPLPHDLSAETTKPILSWAKRILEENNRGPLEFIYHFESNYNVETVCALTDFVKNREES